MPNPINEFNRRTVLCSLGLTAAASLLAGCGRNAQGAEESRSTTSLGSDRPNQIASRDWRYVPLVPGAIAADAYRLMAQGGCMYGLFAAIVAAMAKTQGEPFSSFPLHMMKYGAGGVGLWGSLCGTLNGGAAVFGLFERDKARQANLIAKLFSWYEATELPIYKPHEPADSPAMPKSVAGSVLCHVSAGKWCKIAGSEVGSNEMNERCRRLTADVAIKTVELLNANVASPCPFAGPSAEAKSCLSCHGKELHDTLGQMQCQGCHQSLSKKHPSVPNVSLKLSGNPRQSGL
jgi:hypothetical protein